MEKDIISKYKRIIRWSEEDMCYIVEVPELSGCMADGKTIPEALKNADRIIGEWLETAMENGRSIPQPARLMKNDTVSEAVRLMEMLPESEQEFALQFIRKLVLAWDPDYTKVTPKEKEALDEAVREFANGETISHESVDWN